MDTPGTTNYLFHLFLIKNCRAWPGFPRRSRRVFINSLSHLASALVFCSG